MEFLDGQTGGHLSGGFNGTLGLAASAVLGDINGDGIDDYALSSTDVSTFADHTGGARIYSGATRPLRPSSAARPSRVLQPRTCWPSTTSTVMRGRTSSSSRAGFTLPGPNSHIAAFSSATGALLWTITPPGVSFGSMVNAGDIDGDGHDDLLANGIGLSAGGFVYSARDGSLIQTLPFGPRAIAAGPGASTPAQCAAGDTNGDGIAEIATLEPLSTATNFTTQGPIYTGTTLITRTQSRGGQTYGGATPAAPSPSRGSRPPLTPPPATSRSRAPSRTPRSSSPSARCPGTARPSAPATPSGSPPCPSTSSSRRRPSPT
ncbi:MAG: hypothetical protein R3F20_06530 [Planctomycetota bacterium]